MSSNDGGVTQERVAITILSFVREDGKMPAKSDILSEVSGDIIHDKASQREFLEKAADLESVAVGSNRIYVGRPERLRRQYKHSKYDFKIKTQ